MVAPQVLPGPKQRIIFGIHLGKWQGDSEASRPWEGLLFALVGNVCFRHLGEGPWVPRDESAEKIPGPDLPKRFLNSLVGPAHAAADSIPVREQFSCLHRTRLLNRFLIVLSPLEVQPWTLQLLPISCSSLAKRFVPCHRLRPRGPSLDATTSHLGVAHGGFHALELDFNPSPTCSEMLQQSP